MRRWYKDADTREEVRARVQRGETSEAIARRLGELGYQIQGRSLRWQLANGFLARYPAPEPEPELAAEPVDVGRRATADEQQRRRAEEIKAENAALRRDAADRADLLDALRDDMDRQPVLSFAAPAVDPRPHRSRSLVLFLSDVHFGQLFERASGGGLGEYNLDVAEERIRRISEKTAAIAADLRQSGPVDRLVIILGGDLVDGRDIHPGHDIGSVPMAVQLRRGSEMTARLLIAPLASVFPKIDIYDIPGNHGRIGKKGQLDRTLDNFDTIFTDFLALRCASLTNLTWHRAESWFCHFKLHGFRFFAAHGDSFKSWAGIPFYGAQRFLARVQSMLHAPVDALLVGHHHNAAEFPQGWANIVMNGSVVGTGSFGSWLGYSGAPVQKLILVTDHYPVATTYNLILANRDEMLTNRPDDLDA